MKNSDINLDSITGSLSKIGGSLKRYRGIIFFVLLAVIYGLLVFRINTLSNIDPGQNSTQQASTKQPHIDPSTVQKIQSLQDNSVNVQSLFDNARENPFQE